MGILFRDGAIVFDAGQIVFTNDPSSCRCCVDPCDCDFEGTTITYESLSKTCDDCCSDHCDPQNLIGFLADRQVAELEYLGEPSGYPLWQGLMEGFVDGDWAGGDCSDDVPTWHKTDERDMQIRCFQGVWWRRTKATTSSTWGSWSVIGAGDCDGFYAFTETCTPWIGGDSSEYYSSEVTLQVEGV